MWSCPGSIASTTARWESSRNRQRHARPPHSRSAAEIPLAPAENTADQINGRTVNCACQLFVFGSEKWELARSSRCHFVVGLRKKPLNVCAIYDAGVRPCRRRADNLLGRRIRSGVENIDRIFCTQEVRQI